jgi:hypothetical protein
MIYHGNLLCTFSTRLYRQPFTALFSRVREYGKACPDEKLTS